MTDEQKKGYSDIPQDISDSKDEAEKSFLRELDEAEKAQPTAAPAPPQSKGPAGGDKSKSMFSSAVDSLSKPKRKRDIDPILGVSLAVFILCSVVVLGNYAYGEIVKNNTDDNVHIGDVVYVQYTGAYGGYYDPEDPTTTGAVVFDNNIEDIGKHLNKDDSAKERSWSFSFKSSYSDYKVTVGSRGSLAGFEDILVGHKVGETVQVTIPAKDAYESTAAQQFDWTSFATTEVKSIPKVMVMTSDQFTALTGYTCPSTGLDVVYGTSDAVNTHCPFGWSYRAWIENGSVHMENFPTATTGTAVTYHPYGQDGAAENRGTVTITAEYTAGTDKISVKFDSSVTCGSNGHKHVKVPVIIDNVWVPVYGHYDSSKLLFRTVENLDTDLYFTIKIVKKG